MKIISSKSIFASLIIVIILSFVINIILNDNEKFKNVLLNETSQKNSEKILGVKIRQQNKKGEKFCSFVSEF